MVPSPPSSTYSSNTNTPTSNSTTRRHTTPNTHLKKDLTIQAVPGLITLLDEALYRANEGGLTATVSAGDVLLGQFFELGNKAKNLLKELLLDYSLYSEAPECCDILESFSRLCIEVANGAIETITQDKLALASNVDSSVVVQQAQNQPNNNNNNSNIGGGGASSLNHHHHHHGVMSGSNSRFSRPSLSPHQQQRVISRQVSRDAVPAVTGASAVPVVANEALAQHLEYANSAPSQLKRRRDCYETTRLICPDYVWADYVILYTKHALKAMQKHPALAMTSGSNDAYNVASTVRFDLSAVGHYSYQEQIDALYTLIKKDLPAHFSAFRAATGANTCTSKRLYLVKCEYRAPFRSFAESHRNLQRAPSRELVDEFVNLKRKARRNGGSDQKKVDHWLESLRTKKQEIIENPILIEAFQAEHCCEVMELAMSQMLYPFAELARVMESKNYRLREINELLGASQVLAFREVLRRLKSLLLQKSSSEATGIRPLLLDLQGISRDSSLEKVDIFPFGEYEKLLPEKAIKKRIDRLMKILTRIVKVCRIEKEMEFPAKLLEECESLDQELFHAQYEDWYTSAKRQMEIKDSGFFDDKPEIIRMAEVNLGIMKAPLSALEALQGKLEAMRKDRMKRFEFLSEIVSEVCLREMNLTVVIEPPNESTPLKLAETSVTGVFGSQLCFENESLPIG